MTSFVLRYDNAFLQVCFRENRDQNKIIYEGNAFIIEHPEDHYKEENYALSFRFASDGCDWQKIREANIESPFSNILTIAKQLGRDILIAIETYIAYRN